MNQEEDNVQIKLNFSKNVRFEAFFLFYLLMVNSSDYGLLFLKKTSAQSSLSFLGMISEIPFCMSQTLIYTIFMGLLLSIGKIFYLKKQSYEIEIFCVILFPLQFYLCLNKILNDFYYQNQEHVHNLSFFKLMEGLVFVFIIIFHTLAFLIKALKTNFRYSNSRIQGFNSINYYKILCQLTRILLLSILPTILNFQNLLYLLTIQTIISSYLYLTNIVYEHPKIEILAIFGQVQGWMQLIKLFIVTQTNSNFQLFNFVTPVLILAFYIKPQKISKIILQKYQKVFQTTNNSGYVRMEEEIDDFFSKTKQQQAIIKFSLMTFYYLEDEAYNLQWPAKIIRQMVKQLEKNCINNSEIKKNEISFQKYQYLIIKSNKPQTNKKHEYQNLFWNYVNNQSFFKTQDNFKYFYIYNMILGGTRNKYRVLSVFHKIKGRKNIFQNLQIQLAYNFIIQFICRTPKELHGLQQFFIGNDPNLHSADYQQIMKQEKIIQQVLNNMNCFLQNQQTFQKYHLNQKDDKFQIEQYLFRKHQIKKDIKHLLLSSNYVSLNNRIISTCLTYIFQKFILKQKIRSSINFKNNIQSVKSINKCQFQKNKDKKRLEPLIQIIKKNEYSNIEQTFHKNNMIAFCSGYRGVGEIVLSCQNFKRNLLSNTDTNSQKQNNICDFMLPFIINKHFLINQNINVFDKLFDHSRIKQYITSKNNVHVFEVDIQIKFLPTHLNDLLIAINFIYDQVKLIVTDQQEKQIFNNMNNSKQKQKFDRQRSQTMLKVMHQYKQVIFGQSFNFIVKKNENFKFENSSKNLRTYKTINPNSQPSNLLNKSINQIQQALLIHTFSNTHLIQQLKFSNFKNKKNRTFLRKIIIFVSLFFINMAFCVLFTWTTYSNIQNFAQNRENFIIEKRQIYQNFGMNDQTLSINVGALLAVKQKKIIFNTQSDKQKFLQSITSSMQSVRNNINKRYSSKQQQKYLKLNFGQLLYSKDWVKNLTISFYMRQLLLETQASLLCSQFYNFNELQSLSASNIVQNNLINFKKTFFDPFLIEIFNLFSKMTYVLATQPEGINLSIQKMQEQLSKYGLFIILLLLVVGLAISIFLTGLNIYIYLTTKNDCLQYLSMFLNCSKQFMDLFKRQNQSLKCILQIFKKSQVQNLNFQINRIVNIDNQINSSSQHLSKKNKILPTKNLRVAPKINKQLEFAEKQQIKINPVSYSKYKLIAVMSIFLPGVFGYIQMALSINSAIAIWNSHSESINKLNLIVLTQKEIIRTLYLNQVVGLQVNLPNLKKNLQILKDMNIYKILYELTSDSDFTRQLMNIQYQNWIGNSTFNLSYMQIISNINLNIQIILNHNTSHSKLLGQQNSQFLAVNKLIRPFSNLTLQIINKSWMKISVISKIYRYWFIFIQILIGTLLILTNIQAIYMIRDEKIWRVELLSMLLIQNLKIHPQIQKIINFSQRQEIPHFLQAIDSQ